MNPRPRTDPLIPSEPLLAIIPTSEGKKGRAWCNRWGEVEVRPYGRKLFAAGLAERLGIGPHQGALWVAKIVRGEPVPLWLADEVCSFAGIPFAYVYAGVPLPDLEEEEEQLSSAS